MSERKKSSYRSLFGNRNFATLWLGQAVSFLGDYFYFLAIPLMVNTLTGSALQVGLATIANAVPVLVLGPIAGVFVDRWNRKTTMIVADLLRGVLVLPCLLVQTADQVWIFYVCGFFMSCASRFFFPAQNAALPGIIEDTDDLLAANGLMQAVQTVGMLAGPALAGFAIGLWGAQVAFAIDSLSFFISAFAISLMNIPHTPRVPSTAADTPSAHPFASVMSELRDGLSFLAGNRILRPMIAAVMVAHLTIGGVNVAWVPFLQRTFGVGAVGLGLVDSLQGVGMLVSGLLLGVLASHIRKIPLAAASLALIGLCFAGMGLAPAFWIILVCSFGIGLAMVPAGSVLTTILQIVTPDEKRGRVGSAVNALGTASGLLAMAAVSLAGDQVGLGNVYLLCGIINWAAALLTIVIGQDPEDQPVPAAA